MGSGLVIRFDVVTLFPEMFPGPLAHSLAGKALERGDWTIETIDIRTFATATMAVNAAAVGAAVALSRLL